MSDLRLGSIAIPGLSALLGGVVGALLSISLVRKDATPNETRVGPETLAAATPQPGTALDGRVAALERSLQALSLEQSVARAIAKPAPAAVPSGDAPEVADVAPIVDNPVFEAAVRDVMDRAEQERDLEREAQRAEWRKRTAEEWGAALTEKLRLTETQKAKLIEIANDYWTRLRDLRQTDAGAPATREQRRDQLSALRKSAEGELAKVLDAAQLTSYQELEESARLGGRGQRGGRRGD